MGSTCPTPILAFSFLLFICPLRAHGPRRDVDAVARLDFDESAGEIDAGRGRVLRAAQAEREHLPGGAVVTREAHAIDHRFGGMRDRRPFQDAGRALGAPQGGARAEFGR